MGRFDRRRWRQGLVLALLFFGCAGSARAEATFPPMRPGLWETSTVMLMNMSGQPPDNDTSPTVRYNCQSAASMAQSMKIMSAGLPGCTMDLEGGGGQYTMTINCVNPGGQPGTMHSTGTMAMRGDTAIHMTEAGSGNIGGMQMSSTMTADSKWVGACPSGVVPGDYGTMANGVFTKEGNTLTPP
jgi:hypothetical protein